MHRLCLGLGDPWRGRPILPAPPAHHPDHPQAQNSARHATVAAMAIARHHMQNSRSYMTRPRPTVPNPPLFATRFRRCRSNRAGPVVRQLLPDLLIPRLQNPELNSRRMPQEEKRPGQKFGPDGIREDAEGGDRTMRPVKQRDECGEVDQPQCADDLCPAIREPLNQAGFGDRIGNGLADGCFSLL
jgi:hypothetical protein